MADPIKLEVTFGFGEVQSQLRFESPSRLVGYSRRIDRDRQGVVTRVGEWSPTGAALVFPESEPKRPWWKFWG